MAYNACCCCVIETKYRKKTGGCKVINDGGIQVSDIDSYLNEIMKKNSFSEFISVKLVRIHVRPVRGINDTDSSDEEEDDGDDEVVENSSGRDPRVVSPSVITEQ